MKKLILRCDDYGCATGANEAYLRLADTGIKFNASILICGPTSKENLDILARHAPHIGLGIHTAINAEWDKVKWGPVGDLKQAKECGLADANGHFHLDTEKLRAIPAEVILDEIRAQIERALSWSVPFSYVDEHMGYTWMHNLREPLAALAKEHGLIYRPELPGPKSGKTDEGLIANWRLGLKTMDNQPHLMVTHPVIDDDSTRALYMAPDGPGSISRDRQAEFDALSSAEWRETLAQEEIELITYRDL